MNCPTCGRTYPLKRKLEIRYKDGSTRQGFFSKSEANSIYQLLTEGAVLSVTSSFCHNNPPDTERETKQNYG